MRIAWVILLGLFLVGCEGVGSLTDQEYVARAQDFLDKGELQAAVIELKNALGRNPDNPQARWLLGKLYMDTGNLEDAEKELRKAGELGVTGESVLPLLAQVYLRQGRYEAVDELVIEAGFSKRSQASMMTSLGLAQLARGDMDGASASIERALSRAPDSAYARYGRARLSVARKKPTEARRLLGQILEQHPDYAPAWSLLGDLELEDRDMEAAEQSLTKAIDGRRANTEDLLKRALVRIQLQRYDKAQEDLDRLKSRVPKHPGVNYEQGLVYFLQKRYPEAQDAFEQALSAKEDYLPVLYYLGATHYLLGNSGQSEHYLNRFLAANPGYIPARKLAAVQALEQRNYARVEELMRPVVANRETDVAAINLLANALIGQGRTDQGIRLLEQAVQLQPDSASARTRLGIGLLSEGRSADGVTNLQAAIEVNPAFQQAGAVLVMSYLQQKKLDQAQKAAEALLKSQPDHPLSHNLMGLVYLRKKQPDRARAAFRRALELAPGDPGASRYLAAMSLPDDPDQARTLYRQVLEQHPKHLDTWLRLARLEADLGNTEAMKHALESALAAQPSALQPRILLARYQLQTGAVEQARRTMGDLLLERDTVPAVAEIKAQIQLADKDYPAAVTTLKRLAERQPGSARIHFQLTQAYAGMNDRPAVERELARTLELAPGLLPARILQARMQVVSGRLEEARRNLAWLKKQAADDPEVLAIEAELSARAGESDEALQALIQRFDAAPGTGTLIDLTRYRWALGQHQAVIDALEGWVGEHADDNRARMALADAYLALEQLDQAVAQYKKVLEYDATYLPALNNLAWYLKEVDPQRALGYAEEAYRLAPESLATMDTLAELLLGSGDLDRAERLNQRCLKEKPGDPSFNYRKAKILLARGNRSGAADLLESLLEAGASFPERGQAEALLKRLGG